MLDDIREQRDRWLQTVISSGPMRRASAAMASAGSFWTPGAA
jgi:hypothetical protein